MFYFEDQVSGNEEEEVCILVKLWKLGKDIMKVPQPCRTLIEESSALAIAAESAMRAKGRHRDT